MKNIKSTLTKFVIASLTLMSFASCTKIIDVEVDPSNEKLVINAILTTDTTSHIVTLSRSIDYFSVGDAPVVSNAKVSVIDNLGNQIEFAENPEKPGEYKSDENSYGIEGNTYTLNVSLETAVGGYDSYQATDVLNPTPILDSIKIFKDPRGFSQLLGYFQDSPEEDFYMCWYSKNDTLKNHLNSERYIISDKVINGLYFDGIPVGFLEFDEGDPLPGSEIKVFISGISEEHFQFLADFSQEAQGQNPLFSGPPANISTNLNHDAAGFFATYSTTTATYIVPE
ncbi:MAG: DUF4249 domain-containing protein [Bacteroidales bacterium]|nr:DUF4249 domain-containing protein [Bacteroidales bacterium]